MSVRFGVRWFGALRSVALGSIAAGVLVAGAVLSGPAEAAPFTNRFAAFEAAIRTRLELLTPDGPPSLMREYRAATYSLDLMARPSDSLVSDARLADRLSRRSGALLRNVEAELDTAILGLGDDAAIEIELAAAETKDVVTQPARGRVSDLLAQARAALLILSAPSRQGPDAAYVVSALRSVELARRAAEGARACPRARTPNGSARMTALFDGIVFAPSNGGAVRTLFDADGVDEVQMSLLVMAGTAERIGGAVSIEWPSGAFTGVGEYEVDAETGISLRHTASTFTRFAASGRVTVFAYDGDAGTVEGAFDAVLEDGNVISKGRFRVCNFRTVTPAVIGGITAE